MAGKGFIGAGELDFALYSSGATFGARKFEYTGNTKLFEFSISPDEKRQKNYETPQGGTSDYVVRIESATIKVAHADLSIANAVRSLWATKSTIAAGTVTDEANHNWNPGGLIPTNFQLDTAQAVTVKKGATTINAADYTISAAGIRCVAGTPQTAGLLVGDAVTITYTKSAVTRIEGLTSIAPILSFNFHGYNLVDGREGVLRGWKMRLGAPDAVGFIGDDFSQLAMSGELLLDTTVPNAGGTSQWFNVDGLFAP